jgi:hypothetical protein
LKLVKNIIFVCSLIFSLGCLLLFGPKILNKLQVKNQTRFESNFINPIIDNSEVLKYSPVKNSNELNYRIDKLIVDIDSIEFAYENIKLESSKIERNFIGISYNYKGSTDTVFAYFKKSLKKSNDSTGFLVIPGSGINQSSEIYNYNNIENNYQSNIDDICQLYGDVFILVKPNQDFLAIHNGEKKIGEASFVNYLINKGSSYSGYYFIQSLVLSKYIKERYNKTIIAGLSQGGYVALLNSLQSHPDKSIIASGYSILFDGPNQFILPALNNFFNSEYIKNNISKSNTNYLFTYGKHESGIYGQEANEYITENYFKQLQNITMSFHEGKHIYDSIASVNFIKQKKE